MDMDVTAAASSVAADHSIKHAKELCEQRELNRQKTVENSLEDLNLNLNSCETEEKTEEKTSSKQRRVSFMNDIKTKESDPNLCTVKESGAATSTEILISSVDDDEGEEKKTDVEPEEYSSDGEYFRREWFARDILDKFDIIRKIGQGGFATVFLTERKSSTDLWAMKVCNMKVVPNKQRFYTEVDALLRVDHPSVIHLDATIEADNHVYLILEYCHGGELLDWIMGQDKVDELAAAEVMYQVFDAVNYLHSKGIVHRDLKPENILLVDAKDVYKGVKLSDFGIASLFEPDKTDLSPVRGGGRRRRPTIKSSCGTPEYLAPEVLKGQLYDHSCDLWSCGVIIYNLLGQSFPFFDDNKFDLMKKVIEGDYNFVDPVWSSVSESAKNLIRKLLQVVPIERLSASEALHHAWVKQARGGVKVM